MRPHIALFAVAGLALLSFAIVLAGRPTPDAADVIEIDDVPGPDIALPLNPPAEPEEPARKPSQQVDAHTGFERVAPRPPLSELAAPQEPKPPKAVPPDRWRSTRLFNPVASGAGVVEAQGYRVALAGIEPLGIDANCNYAGRQWPCGVQARTAFRAWLRARAISCKVPPEPDRTLISAECMVGKEDPAQWLAENGWAKPVADGAYAAFGKKAQEGRRGMFGPPPMRGGSPVEPPVGSTRPEPVDPAPPPATPPASLPEPSQ